MISTRSSRSSSLMVTVHLRTNGDAGVWNSCIIDDVASTGAYVSAPQDGGRLPEGRWGSRQPRDQTSQTIQSQKARPITSSRSEPLSQGNSSVNSVTH